MEAEKLANYQSLTLDDISKLVKIDLYQNLFADAPENDIVSSFTYFRALIIVG